MKKDNPKPKPRAPQQPWGRRHRESEEAHKAFLAYRDLGADRTLERASRDCTKSLQAFKFFSAKWDWIERCRHWDNFLQSERDKVAARYQGLWERRRVQALKENYEIAQALRAKAKQMLAFPLVERNLTEDGRTILKPLRWSLGTALDAFRLAAEIESAVLTANRADDFNGLTAGELAAIRDAGEEAIREMVEGIDGEEGGAGAVRV